VLDISLNESAAFLSNLPEFPASCHLVKFVFTINVSQMLANSSTVYSKHFGHLGLRCPEGISLIAKIGPDTLVGKINKKTMTAIILDKRHKLDN